MLSQLQYTKLACLRQHYTEQYQVLKHAEIGSYFRFGFVNKFGAVIFHLNMLIVIVNLVIPTSLSKFVKHHVTVEMTTLSKYMICPASSVRSAYQWAKLNFFKTGDAANILPEGITREKEKGIYSLSAKLSLIAAISKIITERPVGRRIRMRMIMMTSFHI